MTCSPAQLAANRANAQRSTGPRTEEGKKASRANAVKHGMTGAGIALPGEDAEAVAGRYERLRVELRPSNELAEALVERVAMLTVRLKRCSRNENAATSARVLRAGADFDEARKAEADLLMQMIGQHPATNLRRLRQTPEGVDALIAQWGVMNDAIEGRGAERWDQVGHVQADWLTGHDSLVSSDFEAYTCALHGRFEKLTPDDLADAGPAEIERRTWARARIIGLIDGEVAALKAHRETLDTAPIEAHRALAPDLALFDPSKEATLARKYEAAAERSLFRTLQELRQVEADARLEDISPAPEPEELGSFSPVDEPDRPEPDEPEESEPARPDFDLPEDAPVVETAPQARPGRPGPGRS